MYMPTNRVWAHRLRAEGWTPVEIALHLGIALNRVEEWLEQDAPPDPATGPRPRHKGLTRKYKRGTVAGDQDASPYDISHWRSYRDRNGILHWEPAEDVE